MIDQELETSIKKIAADTAKKIEDTVTASLAEPRAVIPDFDRRSKRDWLNDVVNIPMLLTDDDPFVRILGKVFMIVRTDLNNKKTGDELFSELFAQSKEEILLYAIRNRSFKFRIPPALNPLRSIYVDFEIRAE